MPREKINQEIELRWGKGYFDVGEISIGLGPYTFVGDVDKTVYTRQHSMFRSAEEIDKTIKCLNRMKKKVFGRDE